MNRANNNSNPENTTAPEIPASNTLTNESIALARKKTAVFSQTQGRQPRMLVTAVDQKNHIQSTKRFASLFSEIGFDVDISLLYQTPRDVVKTAVENDGDLICVASDDYVSPDMISRISKVLKTKGAENIFIIVGCDIPPKDDLSLYRAGAIGIVNIHRLGADIEGWLRLFLSHERICASIPITFI